MSHEERRQNLLLGQRLAAMGGLNYEMLEDFLTIFSHDDMVAEFTDLFRQSNLLERLLKAFSNRSQVNRLLILNQKGWFECAASAANILRADISGHSISPAQRQTQESTSTNQKYGQDPIHIEEGDWETHFKTLASLVGHYDRATRTPAFFFPPLLPQYVRLEGDVR
jgi:hypothetical protein